MRLVNILKLSMFIGLLGLVWSCKDDEMTDPVDMTTDPPVAAFSAAPNELTVQFTNNSSNADSYSWDFGDSAGTSTDENPSYTYASAGDYTVTLTASNSDGESDSFSASFSLASANEKLELLVGTSGTKTWKLVREGTAILLASDPEYTNIWWPGTSNNGERPCLYDDSFTFNSDGTFAYDDAGTFWAEFGVFNGVDGCDQNTTAEGCFDALAANMVNECGDDVSAWLSNSSHTFSFDVDNNKITLSGNGVWMGIPKLGTTGETIVPLDEVTYDVVMKDGGAVDTMFVSFNYPGAAFWPMTYVSYENPSDEPELITSFEPPECEPLPAIAPMELSHTFETAASTVGLAEIVESATDVVYGVDDPADAAAAKVGEFVRTDAQFQELQFRLDTENSIDFSNMSTISVDVYLPSTNVYGDGVLTQDVFIGFGAITCPPNWWEDLHQYRAEGLALDEWVTVSFDIDTPSDVVVPDNGATVLERNDMDMIFIQIGGGNHTQAGTFYIRNFVVQ